MKQFLILSSAILSGSLLAQSNDAHTPRPLTQSSTSLIDRGPQIPAPTSLTQRRVPNSAPVAEHPELRPQSEFQSRTHRPDPQQVYWDEQGNRAIWARGAGYKASFDASGMRFIPFLGSSAPQNYPLQLQLAAVRSGNFDWEIAPHAETFKEASTVRMDHGPVDVAYHVDPNGIEQYIHLGEVSLPGSIEITFDLHTELEAQRVGAGWRFANELGGVDFGQAIVFDEAGQSRILDVQVSQSNLTITVPSTFVEQAKGAITVDPLLSNFLIDDFSASDFTSPDVAYSATNDVYCVVYEEDFSAVDADIYSVLLDGLTGATSSGTYMNFDDDNWSKPSIAYQLNNDVFMAVAQARAVGATHSDIVARMRNSAGGVFGTTVTVEAGSSGSNTCINPDIGGDTITNPASYFCVVFEKDFSTDSDVWIAFLNFDGTAHIAPAAMQVSLSADLTQPKVSKSTGGLWSNSIFNVAWATRDLSGSGMSGIQVQQFRWDGSSINSRFFINSDPNLEIFNLDISEGVAETDGTPGGGGRHYIVAYDDVGNSATELTVVLLGGDQVYDTIELPRSEHTTASLDRDAPSIATTFDSWIVAYAEEVPGSQWAVRCAVLQPVLLKLGLSEAPFEVDNATTSSIDYEDLAIASTISGGATQNFRDAMVTYSHENSTQSILQGARVFAQETDPAAGYQYCYGEQNSTGERAFIYAWGSNSTTSMKELRAERLPTNQFCYMLAGTDAGFVANPAGSDGHLCLGGLLGRYNLAGEIGFTGGTGTFNFMIDPTALRTAGGPTVGLAGQTWYFQTWFRDSAAGSGHSNFSNGVAIPLE